MCLYLKPISLCTYFPLCLDLIAALFGATNEWLCVEKKNPSTQRVRDFLGKKEHTETFSYSSFKRGKLGAKKRTNLFRDMLSSPRL